MDTGLLSLKWNNHGSTFFHVLENIRKKELYNDVTIACDGKFFPVHKFILSTCSDYFQEIFEKTQCKHPVIVLKDISHKNLESLLNYMYIGEVNVIQDELSSLIKAAECLKVKGLAIADKSISSKKTEKRLNVSEEDVQVASCKRNRKNGSPVTEAVIIEKTSNELQKVEIEEQSSILKELSEVNIKEENVEIVEAQGNTEVKNETFEDEETEDTVGVWDGPLSSFSGKNDDSNSQFPSTSSYEEQYSGEAENFDEEDDEDMSGLDQLNVSQFDGSAPENSEREQSFGFDTQIEEGIASKSDLYLVKEDSYWKCGYPGCKPYVTTIRTDLQKHIRIHTGEKPFKCESCEYETATSSQLKRHTLLHTGGRPFQCQFCEHAAKTSADLKKHVRTHTGEKPFKCKFCEYNTSDLSALKKHARVHTGEKPYKCNVCEYSTSYSSYLRKHNMVHTKEKPHKCQFCKFSTNNSSYLKKHTMKHTGDKPFQCQFCDYMTVNSTCLKAHKIKKHSINSNILV